MANESVLRSYLISLGYAIDEDGYKKFKANLQDTSKKMSELGLAAIGAAAELTASVIKIASNLERLYFASQRTGATAKNIQALEFGAQQIGISADEARGALEGMAAALRTSPGLVGYLRALNINPNQDGVKLLLDLVDRLWHMPFYQAAAIASMFGIDQKTLFMMEKNFNELRKQMEENQRVNPIDDDKIKKFHEFMEKVRDVTNKLDILANLIASRFVPILDTTLPYLSAFLDKLIALDKETGGVSSVLLGLAAALGSVLGAAASLRALGGILGLGTVAEGGSLIAVLGGLAGEITLIVGGITTLAAAIYALYEVGKVTWHEYHKSQKEQIESHLQRWRLAKQEGMDTSKWEKVTPAMAQQYGIDLNKWADVLGIPKQYTYSEDFIRRHPWAATSQTPVTGDYGVPLHNPGNLRHWMGAPEVYRGPKVGSFAQFATDEQGLSAMAANLLAYSRHGLNTLNTIISTWAPAKDNNNTGAYIADISKRMGVGAGDKLDLSNPAVLTELMKDMIHHEQGRDPYNARLIADAANYRLAQGQAGAGAKVTINQDTKIDINGVGDARRAGDQVLKGQRNVNADIVRNVGGAVK